MTKIFTPEEGSAAYKAQIVEIAKSGISGTVPSNIIWQPIPPSLLNFKTGDTVDVAVINYAYSPDGSPVTLSKVTPIGLYPPDLDLDVADGHLKGTVAAGQGGEYKIAVAGVNASGVLVSYILPVVVVSLNITAPTLDTVDPVTLEEGQSWSIDLGTKVIDTGNPTAIEELTWTYAYSGGAIPGITAYPSGLIIGTPATAAAENLITATAKNSAGLEATLVISVTITAQSATSQKGEITGFYSGPLECGLTAVPTWKAAIPLAWQVGQTLNIDMTQFAASSGSGAITGVKLAPGSDPLPLNTDLTTKAKFITGTIISGQESETRRNLSFIFESAAGDSLSSGIFSTLVWNPAGVTPTLESIDAVAGESAFYLNFSAPVNTSTNYVDGVDLAVNDGAAFDSTGTNTFTYVSGGASARLKYNATGYTFTGNNKLVATLTDVDCGIKSVTGDTPVANSTTPPFYVDPPISAQIIFADDFESGDKNHPIGTGGWAGTTARVEAVDGSLLIEVNNENPYSGTYSLQMGYNRDSAYNSNGYSNNEQAFLLNSFHKEVWVSFRLFVPSNFKNEFNPITSDNNKFFKLYTTSGDHFLCDGPKYLFEYNPHTNLDGGSSLHFWYNNVIDGVEQHLGYDGVYGDLFVPDDFGHWMKILMRFKCATEADWIARTGGDPNAAYTVGDGIVTFWKTNWRNVTTKCIDKQSLASYATKQYSLIPSDGFDRGYIMGAANAGFTVDTLMAIDDWSVTTTDPRL